MNAKENNSLSEIQQYVLHLRYKLANYWLYRIDPPKYLLKELNTAECLARTELRECEKFRQQVEI